MPVLPNARQEHFAQGVARGLTALVAHGEAGYKGNKSYACHLRVKPQVQARIAELQEEAEQRRARGREGWLEALWRIAGKAEGEGNYAAAKAALREIGLATPGWYAVEALDGKENEPLTVLIEKL